MLLQGFEQANIKIHLLAQDNLAELTKKQKYIGLFDLGVFSSNATNFIGDECTSLFKHRAPVHLESADVLVCLKPAQKSEYREKVTEKCTKAGWKRTTPAPFKHHLLFEVQNPKQAEAEASTQASAVTEEEDFMDLSTL